LATSIPSITATVQRTSYWPTGSADGRSMRSTRCRRLSGSTPPRATSTAGSTSTWRSTSRDRSGSRGIHSNRALTVVTIASSTSPSAGTESVSTGAGDADGTAPATVNPNVPCSVVPSTALTAVQSTV
jgi:hypothetical protein